ncbi:MAG: PQQ-binding-like beta-propeller repeat protein [Gammaproteobacteria bacterium]|nr:PQQ-binding-like beta-propeller repeat protein [Gammaproteobacteria bacterium]
MDCRRVNRRNPNLPAGVMMTRLIVAVALLACPFAAAGQTVGWPAYGGADGGGHYTPATQISPQNVAQLELAWTHRSGDFREGVIPGVEGYDSAGQSASAFVNTPIVVEDTLYYCTPFNRVFALDPRTGGERWRFDPKVNMDLEHLTNCRAVSSWIDPQAQPGDHCAHRIILPTLDGRIFALDGASGKRCAGFGDNGEIDLTVGLTEHGAREYGITSAPAIIDGKLVTGAYVLDSFRPGVPSGVVRAYDLRSGAFAWGWNPVPPGKPAVDAEGNFTAGTTNVWSTIPWMRNAIW